MEYCGCGSVADLNKLMKSKSMTFSEPQLCSVITQVLKGLAYLHSQKCIHRDLKPANILLTGSGEAKIADFGVSIQLDQTLASAKTTIGTPLYMSPESIEGGSYDNKTDIWALGITCIEIAQGHLPF